MSDGPDVPASVDIFENVCIQRQSMFQAIWMQARNAKTVTRHDIDALGLAQSRDGNIINHILTDLRQKLCGIHVKKISHLNGSHRRAIAALVQSAQESKCIYEGNLRKNLFGDNLF